MQIEIRRGFVGAFGSAIDDLARQGLSQPDAINPFKPTTLPFHITLLTKAETQALREKRNDIQHILTTVETSNIFSTGIGGYPKKGVFFVTILWNAGQQTRERLGLGRKQFHITLSDQDDHFVDKSVGSLLHGVSPIPQGASIQFLDHLAFASIAEDKLDIALDAAVQLCIQHPGSYKGPSRLGDIALRQERYKLAILSYGKALELLSVAPNDKLRSHCIKKAVLCAGHTEWGAIFTAEEVKDIPSSLEEYLFVPWSPEVESSFANVFQTTYPSRTRDSRIRVQVPSLSDPGSMYELPRFFSWLVPFQFALMSTPRDEDDINELAGAYIGIKHVLTLTLEQPIPEKWFAGRKITHTHMPLENFHAPTVEQMDLIIRMCHDETKMPILVHCGGGKGRAGTVAACYLVAYGFGSPKLDQTQPQMHPADAISALRTIRPGSIESARQEHFINKWSSTLWKRQSILPETPSEPTPCPPEIEGSIDGDTDLLVLVGLPGSGKTYFSQAIMARNAKWRHISQDESRSRSSCETNVGRGGGRAILDRCNTSSQDRKDWLSLASWARKPVCVWFDYPIELCISRAQNRIDHPTLPPGPRVRTAALSMRDSFSAPSLNQGFVGVAIIRSFEAAMELVKWLSPPVGLLKFPRTPHLINLGAAADDDLVSQLPIVTALTGIKVIITEKVDGANMGFSLSSTRSIITQNRSHYINPTTHAQFKKLGSWIETHREALYRILDRDAVFLERYILYGEWLTARHSISYTNLPDFFMAFDLYDRAGGRWATRDVMERLLEGTGIALVPVVWRGERMPPEDQLKRLAHRRSLFNEGEAEGIYVKVEKGGTVVERGKVVRGDFIAGNEHWSKNQLEWNVVRSGVVDEN